MGFPLALMSDRPEWRNWLYAPALGAGGGNTPCGFESHLGHWMSAALAFIASRAARLFAISIGAGLIFAAVLLGAVETYGVTIPGEVSLPLISASSAVLGAWSGVSFRSTVALLLAAPLGLVPLATVIGVKAILWPSAPLAGDGFAPLLLIHACAAIVGSVIALAIADRRPASDAWIASTGWAAAAGLLIWVILAVLIRPFGP